MDLIINSRRLLNMAYTVANVPLAFRAVGLKMRFGSEMSKIKELEDTCKGQRCYVLGNGPSLKKVDFSLLADKNVIAVNMLYKYPQYWDIYPIFHCALDPAFYSAPYLTGLEDLLCKRPNIKLLVSTNAPERLRKKSNCYTVGFGYLPSNIAHPFNLAKPSAAFVNVISFAIELAIYLGFSEVVLLGCDFSQFTVRRECHVYDKDSESSERNAAVWQDLLGHYIALMQHESLQTYAKKKGCSVVNASEGSFLETYPLVDLKDWL